MSEVYFKRQIEQMTSFVNKLLGHKHVKHGKYIELTTYIEEKTRSNKQLI